MTRLWLALPWRRDAAQDARRRPHHQAQWCASTINAAVTPVRLVPQ